MYTDETLNCTDCNAPSPSQRVNRSSSPRRASPTSRTVARIAGRLGRASAAAAAADLIPAAAAAAAVMVPGADVPRAKCSRLPAADAARLPRFRSSRGATSPCTAATASRSGSPTARPSGLAVQQRARAIRRPGFSLGNPSAFVHLACGPAEAGGVHRSRP